MATVNASPGLGPVAPTATPQAPVEPAKAASEAPLQAPTPVEAAPEPQAPEVSPSEVREIAESLGQVVSVVNEGISIRIDDSTDLLITEIVNRETDEVIKQIPPQELVELSGRLREFLGILLDIEV